MRACRPRARHRRRWRARSRSRRRSRRTPRSARGSAARRCAAESARSGRARAAGERDRAPPSLQPTESGRDGAHPARSQGLSLGPGCAGRCRGVLRPQARALARVCPMATRSDGSGPGGTGDAFFRPSVRALTPYQPGKPVEDVQRELGLERVVKLASNEGPFGPFPAARGGARAQRPRAEPLSGRRLLPAARGAGRAPRRLLRAGLGRRRRRRLHRHAQPGDPRPRRRDRLRLAVVPELRDLRREAGRRRADGRRWPSTGTTSTRCSTPSRRGRSSSTSATRTTRPGR